MTVVFYERGESRKNFSHAGGMKGSFDRQPPPPVYSANMAPVPSPTQHVALATLCSYSSADGRT